MNKLELIKEKLSNAGYKVSVDVELQNDTNANIVASRTYFSWKGLVILSQHIVIQVVDAPTILDFKNLFNAGFNIGKKLNRVPLLRGLQFGYMIIPIIIANDVSDEVKQFVSQVPSKHWSIFEFPVVFDASSNETIFFKETTFWGAFFFSDLRCVVSKYIE